MELLALFTDPKVEDHAVTFGSMEPPDIRGPGDTPYPAMFVMPRFIWEGHGEPQEVTV